MIITARNVRIIYAREGGFTTSREGGIITEANVSLTLYPAELVGVYG